MKLSGFSQILEGLYTDKLNISRFVEVINTDGTQGVALSKTPIYTDVPCRISFGSTDNPDGATEDKNPERLQLKLFCKADVDIQKGDTITAIRMSDDGKTELKTYKGTANLPAQFVTHQEVLIMQVGDA